MYQNKMVCCLKANGRVLREFKDTVYVKYGSEYSILLKNLNSQKAVVNIEIDGVSATPDGLVVDANSSVDLERFIGKSNDRGNRFKFIKRTSKIEAGPRGIKVEDGLIRVSFKFAKVMPKTEYVDHHIYHRDVHHWWGYPRYDYYGPYYGSRWDSGQLIGSAYTTNVANTEVKTSSGIANSVLRGGGTTSASLSADTKGIMPQNATFGTASLNGFAPVNDIGITVPGSESTQKFQMVQEFPLEDTEHVMVLRLLGDTGQVEVKEAVTVKAKQKCTTCGRNNKATAKFCAECGTALEVFV